jgi:hypothetical protein
MPIPRATVAVCKRVVFMVVLIDTAAPLIPWNAKCWHSYTNDEHFSPIRNLSLSPCRGVYISKAVTITFNKNNV